MIANVKTDALVVDGKQLIPLASQTIKDRNSSYITDQFFVHCLGSNGSCDGPPVVTCLGVGQNTPALDQQVETLIGNEIETLSLLRSLDENVINACTKAIKRFCR